MGCQNNRYQYFLVLDSWHKSKIHICHVFMPPMGYMIRESRATHTKLTNFDISKKKTLDLISSLGMCECSPLCSKCVPAYIGTLEVTSQLGANFIIGVQTGTLYSATLWDVLLN
jgi:hypothetical protein